MTSDDSGLNFQMPGMHKIKMKNKKTKKQNIQMPGPEAKIGEEACRGAGSQNNLEVELQGYRFLLNYPFLCYTYLSLFVMDFSELFILVLYLSFFH